MESQDPSLIAVMAKLSALEHGVGVARKNLSIVMGVNDEDGMIWPGWQYCIYSESKLGIFKSFPAFPHARNSHNARKNPSMVCTTHPQRHFLALEPIIATVPVAQPCSFSTASPLCCACNVSLSTA